jgi:hypothetical protein
VDSESYHDWFYPQASPQLPSWVFDFTHGNAHIDENGRKSFVNTIINSVSDASAGSGLRLGRCDGTSIHVAGFAFDEILDISRLPDPSVWRDPPSRIRLIYWMLCALRRFRPLMPSSREIGICTRAFIRTFGSDHKTLNRLTLAELHLPDSVCWQQGPMAVMEAIFKQVDMVEATGNFEGFEKLCALE